MGRYAARSEEERDEVLSQSPAAVTALRPVSGRPPLPEYLAQLWQRRFFIKAEARAKAFSTYRNTVLGKLWLILAPLLDSAVYGVIFGYILKTSRGVEHFIPYLLIGVTFFGFSSAALNGGCGLIRTRKNIIKAFTFPRAAVVLSHALKNFYDTLPVIGTTLVAICFVSGSVAPRAAWFLLVEIYILQLIFNLGLTFFSAWASDILPDLKTIFNYGTRFWFYGSGVFFSIDRMVHDPFLLSLLHANPAYLFLSAYRTILIDGAIPRLDIWIELSLWAIVTLVVSFVLFWSREVEYSRG